MTEYDPVRKQWQFISDENDIETIFKKLDWIAEIIYQSTRMSIEQQRKYMELFGKKE